MLVSEVISVRDYNWAPIYDDKKMFLCVIKHYRYQFFAMFDKLSVLNRILLHNQFIFENYLEINSLGQFKLGEKIYIEIMNFFITFVFDEMSENIKF